MNATSSVTVQLRLDPLVKLQSLSVFKRHGLTLTQGIRNYLEHVAKRDEIPLDASFSCLDPIPNEETLQAFKESEAKIGWNYAKDANDLFRQLNI